MKGPALTAALTSIAALAFACAHWCTETRAATPAATIADLLFGQEAGSENVIELPDPDPEPPPSFGLGHRPEAWAAWEFPGRMRRFSGRFHIGLANFIRDRVAFEADNPTLYLTADETVMVESLWTGNSIALSLEGTVHFTPLVGLSAELSWVSFRRQVSPPTTYVDYDDATHNTRLISASDLNLLRLVVCTRIDVPAYEALFKPGDLFIFDGAPEKQGFVPFIELGAGLSLVNTVSLDVSVTDGASVTTTRRTLYDLAINPAFMFGAGAEYRIGLFGVFVKFTYAWNGKPKSGWSPYTDTVDDLNTYQFNLGAAAYF